MATKVGANGRTVVHKDSGGTVSFVPDVCLTPQPSGPPVPIPYPNTAVSADADKGAKSVLVDGNPILVQGSCFKQSTATSPVAPAASRAARRRGPPSSSATPSTSSSKGKGSSGRATSCSATRGPR